METLNKWQQSRHKRWDRLLNIKRGAETAAEGAREFDPANQRLVPKPRKRKGGKRNLQNSYSLCITTYICIVFAKYFPGFNQMTTYIEIDDILYI